MDLKVIEKVISDELINVRCFFRHIKKMKIIGNTLPGVTLFETKTKKRFQMEIIQSNFHIPQIKIYGIDEKENEHVSLTEAKEWLEDGNSAVHDDYLLCSEIKNLIPILKTDIKIKETLLCNLNFLKIMQKEYEGFFCRLNIVSYTICNCCAIKLQTVEFDLNLSKINHFINHFKPRNQIRLRAPTVLYM